MKSIRTRDFESGRLKLQEHLDVATTTLITLYQKIHSAEEEV